jgi:hypothetical protein
MIATVAESTRTSCDHSGCPAEAQASYVKGLLELAFCGHHGRFHATPLHEQGFEPIRVSENS